MGTSDPGLFALKGALRAAIVVPAAFALSLEAVGSEQMALFAAFGSMALLVFVDFGGSTRARVRAYLLLLLAGAVLIALGTVCSHSVLAATAAMGLVAFVVLFAGVLDGYIAAAHSAAMLTFVLPVMVPAGVGELPMRLAGWGLAGALAVPALLLLWPERPRGALRATAARAVSALAALVEAQTEALERMREARPSGVASGAEQASTEAGARSAALRGRFLALDHRPSGTASRVAALARLVDDVGWMYGIARRAPVAAPESLGEQCREIEAAVPDALRAFAARLRLGEADAAGDERRRAAHALERVAGAHEALGHALLADAAGWREQLDEALATRELDAAFRLRQLTFATMRIGRDALLACGDPVADDPLASRRARIDATGRIARVHTSMRSVWFRNSLRGAVGLALAVLIGQLADLQHAFWIVLGTMSVLRSNALATGATIVQALLGTLAGIVVGGLILALVGDTHLVLWAVLPLAVALAAYAPRAISFAAGQGAFSVVVLVLFNLLAPAGWRVGLVRVEDVAIGAGVSLLAGALIWPRGASAVLRKAFGTAYARAADYLGVTIDALLGTAAASEAAAREAAAREASAAAQLLEATARDYLAERSSARGSLDDLTILLAGVARARRVASLLANAHSFARLAPIDEDLPRLVATREAFTDERRELCDWYADLGAAIALEQPAPLAQGLGDDGMLAGGSGGGGVEAGEPAGGGSVAGKVEVGALGAGGPRVGGVEANVRRADEVGVSPNTVVLERGAGAEGLPPGLAIAWAHRHLIGLATLEPMLAQACDEVAARG